MHAVSSLSFSEASSPPTPERALPQEKSDRLSPDLLPKEAREEYKRIKASQRASSIVRQVGKEETLPIASVFEAFAYGMAVAKIDPDTVRNGNTVLLGAQTLDVLQLLAVRLATGGKKGAPQPRPIDKWHELSVKYDLDVLRRMLTEHYDKL